MKLISKEHELTSDSHFTQEINTSTSEKSKSSSITEQRPTSVNQTSSVSEESDNKTEDHDDTQPLINVSYKR